MSDRKYWVFEATGKADGSGRVCFASDKRVRVFYHGELRCDARFNKAAADVFHEHYTVTSGEVPPWLEKPLPKLWAFWVKSVGGGSERVAYADGERVRIPHLDWNGAYTYHCELKFFDNWRVCGTPDLPEWLKKGVGQ